MEAVTHVALPIFALIGGGYAARRAGVIEEAGGVGLNVFVYYFALPSLLFVRLADTSILGLVDWRLLAAWYGGGAVVVLMLLAGWLLLPRRRGAFGVRLLAATFGNVGYMGLPLALTALGREATLPAVLIVVADAVVTVSLGVALIEAGRGGPRRWGAVARTIAAGLAGNPLVLAGLAGALISAAGVLLPGPLRALGELLGAAALPSALFALGASLVGRLGGVATREVALLVALKLAAHPLAVGAVASLLGVAPAWAKVAVLQASLPTAATVFVIAQRYGLDVEVVSGAILLSTVASVITVSALLALLLAG